MDAGNRIVVEAWNTVLFNKFRRFRHLIGEGLSRHTDAALDRYPVRIGDRVLDVGSGFGDMALRVAREVGPQGEVVGSGRAGPLRAGGRQLHRAAGRAAPARATRSSASSQCECANTARMTKSTLGSKYKSLMVRKSHKKAVVALAHRPTR